MLTEGVTQFQGSDPLEKLLSMPFAERVAAVSKDVRTNTDEFRNINPHELGELLGVPSTERPNRSHWGFTSYAEKRSLEDYAYEYGCLSDCLSLVDGKI